MDMLDKKIVDFCAPTLAGLKTGGLFGYKYKSNEILKEEVTRVNELLNAKGVVVEILNKNKNRALIYVYRPSLLNKKFRNEKTCLLLEEIGYNNNSFEQAIECLKKRISNNFNFPHEIGLFLGYPIEDVIGFIENCGEDCKFCGIWKVYDDVDYAKLLFKKYKKCEHVYRKHYSEYMDIQKLTICV